MKQILTLVFIFLSFNCIGQTCSKNDFSPYAIPKVRSGSWYRLNTSNNKSFSVSITAGKLQIVEDKQTSAVEYPFANGKLLAFDYGEWGGGLYYKPFDASKETFFVNGKLSKADNQIGNYGVVMLPNDPVRDLIKGKYVLVAPGNTQVVVPYHGYWLFIQGLAHMGQNYGSLSKLTVQKDSFIVSKIFDLDAAPTTMTIYKDKIFIATYNSFYCIHRLKKELVLDNLFWEGLYPNSIAIINERNIYVGMHGGYAKIDLPKKEVKLFIYNGK